MLSPLFYRKTTKRGEIDVAGIINRSGESLANRSLDKVSEFASHEAEKEIRELYDAAITFLIKIKRIEEEINKLRNEEIYNLRNKDRKRNSSLMSSIDFIFDTNLTEDHSQEDLLRGRVYLAILEFEKVLYKIMDWKLVFTFVG